MARKRKALQEHSSNASHGRSGRRPRARQPFRATSGPSPSFLAALEAQRAAERARQEQTQESSSPPAAAAAVEAPLLPGFVYDPIKKKYFRSNERQKKSTPPPSSVSSSKSSSSSSSKTSFRLLTSLRSREIRSRRYQEHASLSAGVLNSYALRPSGVSSPSRISTSDFHTTSPWSAIGTVDGAIVVFSRQTKSPVAQFQLDAAIISVLRWHPTMAMDAPCLLSAGVASNQQGGLGLVRLHTVSSVTATNGQSTVLDPSAERETWTLYDPWTLEWQPKADAFVVGLHGSVGAALVPVDSRRHRMTYAPKGRIKSDVLAQCFLTPTTVLNGTRNGSLWLWDLRASTRASEYRTPKATASVVCLSSLSDGFQVMTQTMDGGLELADIRQPHRPVVSFASGTPDVLCRSLSHAIDPNEVVVAAPSTANSSIRLYDLQSGRLVSRLQTNGYQVHQVAMPSDDLTALQAVSQHDVFYLA